jgi:hypothetical protein
MKITAEKFTSNFHALRRLSQEETDSLEGRVIWAIGTGADCMQDGKRPGFVAHLEHTLPLEFRIMDGIPMWKTRKAVNGLINEGYLFRILGSDTERNGWGDALVELTDKGVEARDNIQSQLHQLRHRPELSVEDSMREVDETIYQAFISTRK